MSAIPILCYHAVATGIAGEDAPFAVAPARFAQHLDAITARGFAAISVGELLRARHAGTLPPRPIVLTFDDGFADVLHVVAPALRERGMTGTAFVTTGRLRCRPTDEPGGALSWDEAGRLATAGLEIGAHGHDHLEMDICDHAVARHELFFSRSLLQRRTGAEVAAFAYPYGYSSPAVRREAQAGGYLGACGVKHALSSPEDDGFDLARVRVMGRTSAEALGRWLDGRGLRVAPCAERPITRAWRVARRARRAASHLVGR